MARQTGFQQRQPRKIPAIALLRALCLLLFQPRATLEGLAILMGLTQQQTLSKQAVAKRMTQACLRFIQEVLLIAIRSAAGLAPLLNSPVFSAFGRVLIQDSTCCALPAHLARIYPGSRNQHRGGVSYAVLRLQTVYNLLTDQCLQFSCAPYTRNDQKASPDILQLARPGDLILRDLGYFVLSVFDQMQQQGIYFLSRLRHDVQVWTPQGHLRKWAGLRLDSGPLDEVVRIGEDQHLQVRLIARPVPETVAAARRRKLYRDCRNRRPTQERLALLHWDVFITNVPTSVWTTDQALGVYRARWRIETVFKSWKSGFRLTETLRGSATQVEACLYAQLLLITLAHRAAVLDQHHPSSTAFTPLSVIKCAHFWGAFGLMVLALVATNQLRPTFIAKLVQYHCRLDKRRKRDNYLQALQALS